MMFPSLYFRSFFDRFLEKKWVLLPIFCGLLFRLVGLFFAFHRVGVDGLVYGDANGYLELARHLTEGRGFTTWYANEGFVAEQFRTPGLPILLMPSLFIGIKTYLVLQSVAASILIPWLLWRIGSHLFGYKAGLIASWLGAIEPLMIFFSWLPLTEIPFVIFSLAALETALLACKHLSSKFAFISGVLAAYAALIRPGNLTFFALGYALTGLWFFYTHRERPTKNILFISLFTLMVCITPWIIRNGLMTGQYTLTAAGWRNVYTDYTASVLSIEHHSTFWEEKKILKDTLIADLGVGKSGLNDAKNNTEFRQRALTVILTHPMTVVRLQILLGVSYFTNDSYYLYLQRFGFIPLETVHLSSTASFLTNGFGAFMNIWQEMKREYFLPIVGRVVQIILLATALYGFIKEKSPIRWLFALIIFFGFVSSSVIGLGIEGRLRMSVSPLLFLFTGAGLARLIKPHPNYENPGSMPPSIQ